MLEKILSSWRLGSRDVTRGNVTANITENETTRVPVIVVVRKIFKEQRAVRKHDSLESFDDREKEKGDTLRRSQVAKRIENFPSKLLRLPLPFFFPHPFSSRVFHVSGTSVSHKFRVFSGRATRTFHESPSIAFNSFSPDGILFSLLLFLFLF